MIWRPFTQEKTASPPIKIVRGEGAYLISENGEKYLDMISSWFVNAHGHSHPEIAEAVAQQAKTLEHVIFTKFSHDPAERLVNDLKQLLPQTLNKYFFSDNGSTSVEIAAKMAYQYFKNIGEKNRNIFLSLSGGYHGDTFGAMSLSGINSIYHSIFSQLFFKTVTIAIPEYYDGVENIEQKETEILEKLDRTLNDIGDKICALVVEPLLQGAFGMRLYRTQFLEGLVNKVREYGILIIFDEVMTGFYRTGKIFAMNHTNVTPDFVCLSKALSGGFLPLALTVTSEKIYDAFLSDDKKKAFLHGHSYTANPIACAAACKSLEIFQRKETIAKIEEIVKFHKDHDIPNAIKKRTIGIITAFNASSEKEADFITDKAWENGIFIRPLGKTIYLFPSYCVSGKDLEKSYNLINRYLGEYAA